MTAIILPEAEDDIERVFDHYEAQRLGLGGELLEEYRRGLDLMIQHPRAWRALDETYRRYRLHRFPYGVIYRIDEQMQQIVIVAFAHLKQKPDAWRTRP